MKIFFRNIILFVSLAGILSSCARDLSSSTYTSDSTLSSTLEGMVVAVRQVTVKEHDKLEDNKMGMLAGGAMGGVAGSGIGGGTGQSMALVGGAIVGGLAGAAIEQKLGEAKGLEYIIKVDISKLKDNYYGGSPAMRNAISSATTSGLITIVQGVDNPIGEGQKVYVIFSDKRTRVIPAKY